MSNNSRFLTVYSIRRFWHLSQGVFNVKCWSKFYWPFWVRFGGELREALLPSLTNTAVQCMYGQCSHDCCVWPWSYLNRESAQHSPPTHFCWASEVHFNEQLSGTSKWSEIWLSGTPKWSEISILKKLKMHFLWLFFNQNNFFNNFFLLPFWSQYMIKISKFMTPPL